MDMMLGWLRLRTPLRPRSLVYVGLTVTWYGMKPSTKPRSRLLLCLGKEKVSTTPQPFAL